MPECPKSEHHYGGQAVIEGVMMRGPQDFAVSVRKANGEIVTSVESVETTMGKLKWLNRPFLRGTFALIDSMYLGIKALKFAAGVAVEDASANEDGAVSEKQGKVNDIVVGSTMVIGLALGIAIFFFVPILLTKLIFGWQSVPEESLSLSRTLVEGGVKIFLFVLYVFAVSMLKDIRRVFQYHGAEHKTINAYESGVPLDVESVNQFSKVHVRCGTSFIFVVLITGIIVFTFLPWSVAGASPTVAILLRFVLKMALLPLVAGIAYEVIKFAGNHKESAFSRLLVLPGLVMQRITTREPEPQMIEVAIHSLQGVLKAECDREQSAPDPELV